MNEDIQQHAQSLIHKLPITDEERQSLQTQLDQGITPEFIKRIQELLTKAWQDSETELEAAETEFDKEIEGIETSFNEGLSATEQAIDTAEAEFAEETVEVGKILDEVELEAARDQLS
jgi:hypothetical protein